MISNLGEIIVRDEGDWCYTLFQTLSTNTEHETIAHFLGEIINSRYHFWRGDQFEEGFTWTHSDKRKQNVEHKNVKTFGFYNNADIGPSDYKVIEDDSFENRLMSFILQETSNKDYEMKIRTLIQQYKNQSYTVLQFLPDKLEPSKFSVYTFFIAFILVGQDLKEAVRIEFGQD